MALRITSHHGTAVTFPVTVERLKTTHLRVIETTGEHFTIEPGEHSYERVPSNVLEAIRLHHVPGGLMRIAGEGESPATTGPHSTVEVDGGESAR